MTFDVFSPSSTLVVTDASALGAGGSDPAAQAAATAAQTAVDEISTPPGDTVPDTEQTFYAGRLWTNSSGGDLTVPATETVAAMTAEGFTEAGSAQVNDTLYLTAAPTGAPAADVNQAWDMSENPAILYRPNAAGTAWQIVTLAGTSPQHFVAVRTNDTRNVAPTDAETRVDNVNGDTADIFLSDDSFEEWLFVNTWSLQATVEPGAGQRSIFDETDTFDFNALGYPDNQTVFVRNIHVANDLVVTYGAGGTTTLDLTQANGNRINSQGQDQFFITANEGVTIEREGTTVRASVYPLGGAAAANMVGASATAAGTAGLVPAPAIGDEGLFLRGDGSFAAVAAATNVVGATDTTAGTAGLVPAPAAGQEASFLRGDGTFAATPEMTGATNTTAGTAGIVPAPAAGDEALFLRGDGAFGAPAAATDMTGADATTAGTAGLVPAPAANTQASALLGNGSFGIPMGDATLSANNENAVQSGAVFTRIGAVVTAYEAADATLTKAVQARQEVANRRDTVRDAATAETTSYVSETGIRAALDAIPVMGAADATTAGTAGFAPAPAIGQQGLFLRGDGTFAAPTSASSRTLSVTSPTATPDITISADFATNQFVNVTAGRVLQLGNVTDATVSLVSARDGAILVQATGPSPSVSFTETSLPAGGTLIDTNSWSSNVSIPFANGLTFGTIAATYGILRFQGNLSQAGKVRVRPYLYDLDLPLFLASRSVGGYQIVPFEHSASGINTWLLVTPPQDADTGLKVSYGGADAPNGTERMRLQLIGL